MKVQKNISLKKHNTFGIDVKASRFISVASLTELVTVLRQNKAVFIISGGSNMLLTKDINKLVLHVNTKGIKILKETKSSVYIKVNAGENWHDFVHWCVRNDFGGLENLSLIPGNVGTCPIQNIGAYGVEVKDVIKEVYCINKNELSAKIFKNSECKFGYRNSIFKQEAKGKYIITSVVFKLTKGKHKLHAGYGAIQEELKRLQVKKPTIQSISEAIIAIRQRKLPDPKKIGNCGSFFKNPVVKEIVFKKTHTLHPKMPFYKTEDAYKIPAGWLIEQCGFKGKRFGDAGVHKNQALVLVNYGNATGNEILSLAKIIRESVKKKFEIDLEMEVTIF